LWEANGKEKRVQMDRKTVKYYMLFTWVSDYRPLEAQEHFPGDCHSGDRGPLSQMTFTS
jgi:hypothetical protein